MHRERPVLELAQAVLARQAKTLADRSGQPFERALEIVTDTEAGKVFLRFVAERPYSWVEGYLEWVEGMEARAEYHALLEEELASLRG